MKKTLVVGLFGLMVAHIGGCAFGTRHPILTYTPITKSDAPKNISILVEDFRDERIDKNVIGHVRNGYGFKTADVVTETNIAQWVTDALKAELGNNGYIVVKDRVDLSTQGEILSVYCDSLALYEGKIDLEVSFKKNDQVIFERKYRGSASNMNWAATSNGYGTTLQNTLQETGA